MGHAEELREKVHQRLMRVLDHAVVFGLHVQDDVGRRRRLSPEKPVIAMLATPSRLAELSARRMLADAPDKLMAISTSPGRARDWSW